MFAIWGPEEAIIASSAVVTALATLTIAYFAFRQSRATKEMVSLQEKVVDLQKAFDEARRRVGLVVKVQASGPSVFLVNPSPHLVVVRRCELSLQLGDRVERCSFPQPGDVWYVDPFKGESIRFAEHLQQTLSGFGLGSQECDLFGSVVVHYCAHGDDFVTDSAEFGVAFRAGRGSVVVS